MVLADNDDKGVDDTNLNRYPLFRTQSLGKPKAAEAARIAGTASVPVSYTHLDVYKRQVLEAAKSLDVVPVHRGRTGGLCIVVGTNPEEGGWAVFGSGWTGGVSKSAIQPPVTPSTLPFGPYIAACVAAGEVFKFARLPENTCEAPHSAFFSAWTLRVSDTPDYAGPSRIAVELDALIAGVGAVGSTAVHLSLIHISKLH